MDYTMITFNYLQAKHGTIQVLAFVTYGCLESKCSIEIESFRKVNLTEAEALTCNLQSLIKMPRKNICTKCDLKDLSW